MSKEENEKKPLFGRRRFKNLFIDSGMQKRLGANIVAINIGVAGLGIYILINYVSQLRDALERMPAYSEATAEALALALIGIVTTSIVIVIVTAAVNYLAGIYLAHRFAGPARIITESLDEMIAGNPMPRRELRPNDELKEVFSKLQELDAKIHKP